MFERFTDRARKVMALSNLEAQRLGHESIGAEHVLLGLVQEGTGVGANALMSMGVDLRRVRLEVEKRLAAGSSTKPDKRPPNDGAKQVIVRAIEEARGLNHSYLGTDHLILGLVRDEGIAGAVLHELGATIEAAREAVLNILRNRPADGQTTARATGSGTTERFTDRARKVMALANEAAQRLNHEYIGPEHILLGLVRESSSVGAAILKNLGVDLRRVRQEVERLIKAGPEMVTMGKLPRTPGASQVLGYATEESQALGHQHVGTEHLLLGLARGRDGIAALVLRELGVDADRARHELIHIPGASTASEPVAKPRLAPPLSAGCPMCNRIRLIDRGGDALAVATLRASYAVLGDNQGCRGWCVVIFRGHAEHLADLPEDDQLALWKDVVRVAAAIRAVFPGAGRGGGPARINYECLGNVVPHIHWHVIPRHGDDPEPTKPVWGWPEDRLRGTMNAEERRDLAARLRAAIET